MTEQIIINGVDVCECEFLTKRENFIYCMGQLQTKKGISSRSYECLENPNCCYKQLKRKKQECEKYKKCLKEIKNIAQNACDNCQECTTEFNLQTSCEYYEILKIINEVESIQ